MSCLVTETKVVWGTKCSNPRGRGTPMWKGQGLKGDQSAWAWFKLFSTPKRYNLKLIAMPTEWRPGHCRPTKLHVILLPVPGANAGSNPSISKDIYTGPLPICCRTSSIKGTRDLCQQSWARTSLKPCKTIQVSLCQKCLRPRQTKTREFLVTVVSTLHYLSLASCLARN